MKAKTGKGKKQCAKCHAYCISFAKVCPYCENPFKCKKKKIVPVNPAKDGPKYTVIIPSEYRGYEIRTIVAIPAGPAPFKLPDELGESEVSAWAYKTRLFHLKSKQFIINEGLIYYARKTLDWTSPEFLSFKEQVDKIEDMRLEEKKEEEDD